MRVGGRYSDGEYVCWGGGNERDEDMGVKGQRSGVNGRGLYRYDSGRGNGEGERDEHPMPARPVVAKAVAFPWRVSSAGKSRAQLENLLRVF